MQPRAERIDTEMVSTFSDGPTVFRGLVANISKTGIKLTGISSNFRPSTRPYATVVSNWDQKFKFQIIPVWFHHNSSKLEVGFKIVAPTVAWHDFLDRALGKVA